MGCFVRTSSCCHSFAGGLNSNLDCSLGIAALVGGKCSVVKIQEDSSKDYYIFIIAIKTFPSIAIIVFHHIKLIRLSNFGWGTSAEELSQETNSHLLAMDTEVTIAVKQETASNCLNFMSSSHF